ncbi:MAG: DUF1824 family protein [Spirulinaceae cyanobacterium]
MTTPKTSNLTIKEAKKILALYSGTQTKAVNTTKEKERLQQAILLITEQSESENLGICANDSKQGMIALSAYLRALGYDSLTESLSIPQMEQPVYIKYNTQRMSHFLDSYTGEYRGVLISCQAEDDEINGTYGYFPLNLFS